MLGVLAGLGLLALASGRPRRLGDAPALPSGDAPAPQTATSVWLLRPADFAHPAIKDKVAARADAEGGPWAVVPSTGWAGAKNFPTAKAARVALTAAGFKGPYGKGASSRWTK